MSKINSKEKHLLEQLMNGVMHEDCSIEETPMPKDETLQSEDKEEELKNPIKTATLLKETHGRDNMEGEKTKKKKKKHRDNEHNRNEFLERTPKMEKSFSYMNLHPSLISPIGLGMFGLREDNKDDRLFNPCVLQPPAGETPMVSPSKMLCLESPAPSHFSLFDIRSIPLTKKLTFGS